MIKKIKVHIIGAGFSGLSLAWELQKMQIPVQLYEHNQIGGMISSIRTPTHLRETAANGILWNRRFAKLADELHVQLAPTQESAKKRFIFRGGKPTRWPLTVKETLSTLGHVLTAKFRKKSGSTLADWGNHLWGPSFTRYVLTPAMRGIFSVAAEKLNQQAVLESFKKIYPGKSKGTYAPLEGMGNLTKSLAEKLQLSGVRFEKIKVQTLPELNDPTCENVFVIATPAWEAQKILKASGINHPAIESLSQISSTPVISATLVWPQDKPTLEGFGCLFNTEDNFFSAGVLINHCLFPQRGPKKSETWIISPDKNYSNAEILGLVLKDRARVMQTAQITQPDEFYVQHWPQALPIYNSQLQKFITDYQLRKSWPKNIYLTGNYIGKIGLAKIYDQNIQLAEQIKKEHLYEAK